VDPDTRIVMPVLKLPNPDPESVIVAGEVAANVTVAAEYAKVLNVRSVNREYQFVVSVQSSD
jgi:hypothetical protein